MSPLPSVSTDSLERGGASSTPFGGASSGAPSALVNGRRWFRQEALGKIGFGGFKVE